ncbi:ankyrin repeat-containing domain protein [Aspergillus keveii]|uniref:Ankyrin repeat-containing domain protein n=1 Tax=Aspergillus keveii TaxID=714993 RepID=A0ABR4FHK5_9EURO
MSFQTLPNELLLLIWAFLEPKEMNALIPTCRRFRDTFNNLLYQHAVQNCPDQVVAWVGEKGQLKTLQEFVRAGGNVTNSPETTPLFAAATHGQDIIIHALIELGADLDMISPKWRFDSALFKAAAGGHLSTVRLLLDAGATVDAHRSGCETSLMGAARGGHDDIILLLLDRGADPAAVNFNDRPVLSYALEGGCSLPIIELLLKATPTDLLDETSEGEPTPLGFAAYQGNIPAAKLLLAAGASLDAGGRDNTPLRVAIEAEEEDMVRFLLGMGADANEGPAQYAPMPLAVNLGLDRILKNLLEQGADTSYVLPWGEIPMDNAVTKHYYRCARLLLDAGALASYKTDNLSDMSYPLIVMDDYMAIPIAEKMAISGEWSDEALLWAARNGNRRIVELSLAHGADIEGGADWEEPYSPLMVATMNGRAEIVRTLLKQGANMYLTDTNGLTALAVAAQRGWVDVVLELLQAQPVAPPVVSLIDLPDDWNRTPLFHATVTGNFAVVEILLAHGSSALDCSTNVSRTPRSVAEEWCRRRLHLDSAQRDTVKAMSDLLQDPGSARRRPDSIGDAETNLTLCSPGEMTGSSHYDLWRRPKTGSKCLMCEIPIPTYAVRFYHVNNEYDVCPECRDGCSTFYDTAELLEVHGDIELVSTR